MRPVPRLLTTSLCAALAAGCTAAPAGPLPLSGPPVAETASAASGQPGAPEGPAHITRAFGGDVHFEEYVADLLKDPQQSLADLRGTLGAADFSMVNLETALTTGGAPENKSFTFRAPPSALPALQSAGVDAVSLANNHAVDYGRTGLADTLAGPRAGPPQRARASPPASTHRRSRCSGRPPARRPPRPMSSW